MDKYSYNGIIMPKLLDWDNTSYPYAFINILGNTAYALSAPLTCEGSFVPTAMLEPLFLCSTLRADENNREYWTEWETVTESTEISLFGGEWSNHDILKSNGSTYLTASEPSPVSYPIVLFDGEVTTTSDVVETVIAATITVSDCLAIGDKVKITLDGVTAEYEVKKVPTSTQSLVGNAGLNGNDIDAEDDGGEWLVAYRGLVSPNLRAIYFYTRTTGTYQLKIELLADKPVTTPQDFYITKNGAGQKQDVYLRVGGQWVKQDEYLI